MIVEAVRPDLMSGGAPLLLGFEAGLFHESGLPTLSVSAAIDVGFGEMRLGGRPAAGDELAAFSLPTVGQSLLAELTGIETFVPVTEEQALSLATDTAVGGGETMFSLTTSDDGFCGGGWWWEDADGDGRINGFDRYDGEVDSSLRRFSDGTSMIRDTMLVNDKILIRHFDTATGQRLGAYLATPTRFTSGSAGAVGITVGPGGVGLSLTDNDGIQYKLEPFPGT